MTLPFLQRNHGGGFSYALSKERRRTPEKRRCWDRRTERQAQWRALLADTSVIITCDAGVPPASRIPSPTRVSGKCQKEQENLVIKLIAPHKIIDANKKTSVVTRRSD
ncbi:hypothetical protein [Pandoraea communis]|uniref:hypothetical protein n=1 Tax=Pandoraea communis TaxID=2508297 RepID=UPI0025A62F6A|nr:hypothetical protein [Pandoraea communis]MDM8356146.1 hypothetical protein [Pandoraea communis]